MRHWSQLATRNWQARRVRTAGVLLAIALGTGAVVWVTCCFESVRRTVMTWAGQYVGRSQIMVESPLGKYDTLPQRLTAGIVELPNVQAVATRLVQRLRGLPMPRAEAEGKTPNDIRWKEEIPEVDFHGIDLANEFSIRDYPLRDGRMLEPADQDGCLLEAAFARESGVGLGDFLWVWGGARDEPVRLEIVGLIERRRIARFQKGWAVVQLPTLQQINVKQGLITSIDVALKEQDEKAVARSTEQIRTAVRKSVPNASVRSVKARLQQIETAQSQQEFVLVLLSCVAMLTALFIILSTLSMGMTERIAQLGLMRCIGLTSTQLGALVLIEVVPLGFLGILLGVPIGLALTSATVMLVPEYVGAFPISIDEMRRAAGQGPGAFLSYASRTLWQTGIMLAAIAGMATTLLAAVLPTFASASVSPLEASRPRARRAGPTMLFVCALLGVGLLALQYFAVEGVPTATKPYLAPLVTFLNEKLGLEIGLEGMQRSPQFLAMSTISIVLLYLGYALLAPLAVWLIGSPAVVVTATATGVRPRLLQDQVGHAAWRSAGICCGLMVGLSLIVGLITFSESVKAGWQFPRQFPEAYIWSFDQMRPDAGQFVKEFPEVREFTAANAVNVIVEERPLFLEKVYLSVTWFMGVEPDSFFHLLRMEFVEGTEAEARRLLKEGGHVIVAEDFARTRNKHLGDEVKVFLGQKNRSFKIAGVIQSPALDIAAGYFQANSEANVVAVGSVIGTSADLERCFGVSGVKLVLMNIGLQPELPPKDWPPARDTPAGRATGDQYYNNALSLERRWQTYREDRLLRDICKRLDAPQAFSGTARELKDEIDRELTRVTRLLTAVPTVALLVAAIGVANLMTASVTSRARQLAILRAVGATRGLVLRMVIGEALVLGILGSALGLALGLHLAQNTATMTARMWGYEAPLQLPFAYLGMAIALTVGLCILAGVIPARHASRTNIVDALHVP